MSDAAGADEAFDFSRDLVDLLTPRPLGDGNFEGDTEPYGVPGRLFGGHFLAQALAAAFGTVADDFLAHSLHASFHAMGDSRAPVRYAVRALRDGRSFVSRHVVAEQNDRVVFSMTASFKTRDVDECFQPAMPADVPAPEALAARERQSRDDERILAPPAAGGRVELVRVDNWFDPGFRERFDGTNAVPIRSWLRYPTTDELDARTQQLLLAFVSDGPLPFCSVILHGEPFGTHQHTSLDHGLWFHALPDVREWVLFDTASVATGSAWRSEGIALRHATGSTRSAGAATSASRSTAGDVECFWGFDSDDFGAGKRDLLAFDLFDAGTRGGDDLRAGRHVHGRRSRGSGFGWRGSGCGRRNRLGGRVRRVAGRGF